MLIEIFSLRRSIVNMRRRQRDPRQTIRSAIICVTVVFVAGCGGEPNTEVLVAPGFHLSGDGRGKYTRGVDDVDAFYQEHSPYKVVFRATQERGGSGTRSLSLNLNDVVAQSGATPLGVMRDPRTQLIVFATGRIDALPIDSAVYGRKTTIHFHSGSKDYALVFEPRPTSTGNTNLTGEGTTPVALTRSGKSTWTVVAPPGSVGRLWEDPAADEKHPRIEGKPWAVNRGLYTFDFSITVTKQ
jgi:hypothetical protein